MKLRANLNHVYHKIIDVLMRRREVSIKGAAMFNLNLSRVKTAQSGIDDLDGSSSGMLCAHCLYELGAIPAMKQVQKIVERKPNDYSCRSCGRSID